MWGSKREVLQRLDRIEYKLDQLLSGERTMAIDLTALTASVQADTDATSSAIKLLQGLSSQIAALQSASTDPATAAAISALASQISSQATSLAAAVTANTPATTP
jgi:cell division septum initiation protein DivIVA